MATLVVAAVTTLTLVRLGTEAMAFDGSAVGSDAPSVYDRRFAGVAQHVPAGAILGYVDDLASGSAEQDAARRQHVGELAAALHRQLQTQRVEGQNRSYMVVLEELYRIAHPDAAGHDVATVTDNLVAMAIDTVRSQRLGNLRHALAPLVVKPAAVSGWVVGDFAPDFDFRALAAQRGLEVAADLGAGAVLFRTAR